LPLQCQNCFVIFELYYLENKLRLDKETKKTIGQSIYFNHDKSVLKARCGLYEIEAFITKAGLNNSTRQSIYIYEDHIDMPPDINNVIALKNTINQTDKSIIVEVDVAKNFWMNCPGTTLNIELTWDKCTKENEGSESIRKELDPIQLFGKNNLSDIRIDLGNEYAYGTRFTVVYSVIKPYNGKNYTKTANSGFSTIETEFLDVVGFLDKVKVDQTSMVFNFTRPYQCYTDFSIGCIMIPGQPYNGGFSPAEFNKTEVEKNRYLKLF